MNKKFDKNTLIEIAGGIPEPATVELDQVVEIIDAAKNFGYDDCSEAITAMVVDNFEKKSCFGIRDEAIKIAKEFILSKQDSNSVDFYNVLMKKPSTPPVVVAAQVKKRGFYK